MHAGHVARMDENELLKKRYSQTVEVKEDVADLNQDGLTGWREETRKLGCRNWLTTAQDRSRWRYLLEKAKAHLGL